MSQCGYCGVPIGGGGFASTTPGICTGCGAPLPVVPQTFPMAGTPVWQMAPVLPAKASGPAGIIGFVLFILGAMVILFIFLIATHSISSPLGPVETRTPSGWQFRYANGNTLDIGNPNLTASQAAKMAQFIQQSDQNSVPHRP